MQYFEIFWRGANAPFSPLVARLFGLEMSRRLCPLDPQKTFWVIFAYNFSKLDDSWLFYGEL